MSPRELMEALDAGEKVTNGNMVVSLNESKQLLDDSNQTPLTMLPFNTENQDDWTIYIDGEGEPRFYRWIAITDNETTVTITPSYYREDTQITHGFELYGDGYTLEELVEARHI